MPPASQNGCGFVGWRGPWASFKTTSITFSIVFGAACGLPRRPRAARTNLDPCKDVFHPTVAAAAMRRHFGMMVAIDTVFGAGVARSADALVRRAVFPRPAVSPLAHPQDEALQLTFCTEILGQQPSLAPAALAQHQGPTVVAISRGNSPSHNTAFHCDFRQRLPC